MNDRSETHGKRTADDSATFTAELGCDNCGFRKVARLSRALHSVWMGTERGAVLPANGSLRCSECGRDAYYQRIASPRTWAPSPTENDYETGGH